MKEIVDIVATTGFPIAITIYLLWERATITNKLTEATNNLANAVSLLTAYIKGEKSNE